MTSSQDDAILISVEGCRPMSRERNVSKNTKKYDEKTIKDDEDRGLLKQTKNDSSRTKRQSIIVEAKLKIIRNV